MNLSGESASIVKNYYNISIDDIIVMHDEIDLPLGEIRHKIGGGSAGHNGLKSLDKHIGNNYHRIRLGVGRPQNHMEVSDYVLQNFSLDEENFIEKEYFEKLAKSYSELISKNFASIVSRAKK